MWFALPEEPIIDPIHVPVEADRGDRVHEESGAWHLAPAFDVMLPGSFSAVVRKRGEAGQGGGLPAAEGAELRHFGTESGGCDLADPGDRPQEPIPASVLGVALDDGPALRREPADLPDQPLDGRHSLQGRRLTLPGQHGGVDTAGLRVLAEVLGKAPRL